MTGKKKKINMVCSVKYIRLRTETSKNFINRVLYVRVPKCVVFLHQLTDFDF